MFLLLPLLQLPKVIILTKIFLSLQMQLQGQRLSLRDFTQILQKTKVRHFVIFGKIVKFKIQ